MVDVRPPPQLRIPDTLRQDRETFGYFEQLNRLLFAMWQRTGGSNDAISILENGELYEPGIETSDADERVDDLETDISILQGQLEQIDEPDYDLFYNLLDRVQSLELDIESLGNNIYCDELTDNIDLNSNAFTTKLAAAESLSAGDICYINTSGKMALANAGAASTSSSMLAMSAGAVTTDDTGIFIIKGFYATSGLTAGNVLYVDTTSGQITSTAPSGSGNIVRIAGYAISATQLFFDPDKTWIEVT